MRKPLPPNKPIPPEEYLIRNIEYEINSDCTLLGLISNRLNESDIDLSKIKFRVENSYYSSYDSYYQVMLVIGEEKFKNPNYEKQLAKYEKELTAYHIKLSKYEEKLKEWQDWFNTHRKNDIEKQIKALQKELNKCI